MSLEYFNDKEIIVQSYENYKNLQLNRPSVLNSLKREQFVTIRELFHQWASDKSVHFVIVSGNGRAFCAGGDLVQITGGVREKVKDADSFVWHEYRMDRDLFYYSKPYISLMNGITMGGGAGLAMPARYRICTETTMWSMPENAIGFYVDVGVTYYLARLPYNIGMCLALTGYRCNAKDCLYAGIATHFVESTQIPQFLKSCEGVTDIVDHLKAYRFYDSKKSMVSGLQENFETIQECFKPDSIEEIQDRLGKVDSKFARDQLSAMMTASPTSLYATFEMMKRAKTLSVDQVLIENYTLASKMFRKSTDFVEGVRAKVIDKDNKPDWSPKTVTKEFIDSLFEVDQVLHFSRL